jgi:transcriptional regulator with XRE-family HTH domain
MKTLAERIAFALEKSGKTQADLVRATGAKSSSVSNWVNGRTQNLKGENLARAAQFLGVAEAWLGAGAGPMERSGLQQWPFRRVTQNAIAQLSVEQLEHMEKMLELILLNFSRDSSTGKPYLDESGTLPNNDKQRKLHKTNAA